MGLYDDDTRRAACDSETTAPATYGRDYASAVHICRDADLIGGRIEWDELGQCPTLNRRPLRDYDVNALREIIHARVRCRTPEGQTRPLDIDKAKLFDAVHQVAHESPFLPQAEYLLSLTWDRVQRLDLMASEILHRPSEDVLAREYLRRWCVAAVARALEPGCQFDHVLILIGPEGLYKSTFFKVLCMPWFTETTLDPTDDDSKLALSCTWVLELSELSSLVNARDREAMLSFITAREDKWRRKYDRMESAIPRHSVIVGTGNRADFISSPDGARRFWPVRVDAHADTSKLRAWRDQIWAEAVHVHKTQGESARWLSDLALGQLATQDRTEHWTEHDAWGEALQEWLSGRSPVTLLECAQRLGLEHHALNMAAQKRIAAVLRSNGYTRETAREGKRTYKRWVLS